jgi:hypothetical protein
MPDSLPLNQKPIQPRIDEPRYGQRVCLYCTNPMSFETKARIHPACKKKYNAKLAAERKTHGTH